jgi:hypothetical protein
MRASANPAATAQYVCLIAIWPKPSDAVTRGKITLLKQARTQENKPIHAVADGWSRMLTVAEGGMPQAKRARNGHSGEPANGRIIRPTSGNALLHHRERTAGAAGGTYRCGLSRMGANVTA